MNTVMSYKSNKGNNIMKWLFAIVVPILFWNNIVFAEKANININKLVKLQDVMVDKLPGDEVKVRLKFSSKPSLPKNFVIDNPPQLVFDFLNIINELPRIKMTQKLSLNLVNEILFASNGDKVRLVINLYRPAPYVVNINDNDLVLTIKNQELKSTDLDSKEYTISALDFHRGNDGTGKLVLDVNSKDVVTNVLDSDGNTMLIEFKNATIPDNLLRKFEVSDFGTPVQNITINNKDQSIFVKLIALGEHEKISYHIDNKYIVEVKPRTLVDLEIEKTRKFKFTGEKISLNFQDIEIRAVLQLLADFTGINLIANDSVAGNVTLRLDNIPWDQALDFILKSKGLAKRENGNVVLIAPREELSKYEEVELSSIRQAESLAPLKTEFLQINYAKADEIFKVIQSGEKNGILSDRGSVSIDARTNAILIKDISQKINDIKDLIQMLDIPVKQVLIEAYMVKASENFSDNIGIKLHGAATAKIGKYKLGLAGDGTNGAGSNAVDIANNGINANSSGKFFDLGLKGDGIVGLALSRLPGGTLLNLELDSTETEGLSTTISKPKILTMDKQAAYIQSGEDIPYVSTSGANGGTSTTIFQKALLKLEVTPQITPNEQISLDLNISNDIPGDTVAGGPKINTTSLKTNVLVNNGETIMLGGLLSDLVDDNKAKIPYFSDIPLLGKLFQNKKLQNTKSELLIFITPRIIQTANSNNNY